MKFTAKYKDGTLILDRPITPKGDTVHVEIPDEEIAEPPAGMSPEPADSEAFAEERAKIRKLMKDDPFLRELWRGLEEGLPPDPDDEGRDETINQRDRRRGFEFRTEWRQKNGRPI